MKPAYTHGSYGGESVTLENKYMRIDIHKRLTGWGWGEIFTSKGKFMAVLDHFGELMIRDQEMPMRLEASEYRREAGDFGERLVFSVRAIVISEKLKGTSFEPWIGYPVKDSLMVGEVTLTLAKDKAVLYISQRLVSKANQWARYIRGPWLKVGQDSFGTSKTDAIFPGMEWLIGEEWSSGTDWFKDPWAQRFVPNPNKVAIPLMALSHDGVGIGLAWNPNQRATQWFNYRKHYPQPVFAVPNFIDRAPSNVMGLMVPDVDTEDHENKIYADPPLELHLEQQIHFDAEVFLCEGDSLDVVVDWVKRHGMPDFGTPRWSYDEAVERIARAFATRFWHPGKGYGTAQHPDHISPYSPRFVKEYIARNPNSETAKLLKEQADWCQSQPNYRSGERWLITPKEKEEQIAAGKKLLSYQKPDGSFPFDPDGRHYTKDDFVIAREYLEPMGLAMDTALDITILPVIDLLHLADICGEESFREGARKALEYCMPMQRPEGGDFWETPLHSPNLLAAGHAAVAYYLGYRAFGEEKYKQKAIHWLRSLLPFTHLWQPKNIPMMYNTKPCLCSSDWYFANWVRDHVQWEVLETFALSTSLGIDWATIDPELDWGRYYEGINVAAMRWMVDHTDENWMPHNMPWTLEFYQKGLFDDCFADTHNSTTGHYGGMVIPPDVIAYNLLTIMKSKKK